MPARLLVLNTDSGSIVQKLPAIGDCDDVFYDAARKRIYAIGGAGGISVFKQKDADHHRELGRISTVQGARTGFFSPELDRLFVAVRRQGTQPAAIKVFVPLQWKTWSCVTHVTDPCECRQDNMSIGQTALRQACFAN